MLDAIRVFLYLKLFLCSMLKVQIPKLMSREFGLIQIKLRSHMSLVELSLTEQHYNYNMIKTKLPHSVSGNSIT